jgi:undecaprenyl phosphate-alpha-L-ara4FN deformylase
MARIALKVDVDTWRGTREGVPALVRLLTANRCGASFLFSLGPDHTGRAILRVLRPGFLGKVSRTSVLEHYGLRTLLHGVLLPGPDIGRREAATLRSVRDAGFEVGVHCWDHVRWQDHLLSRSGAWAEAEMRRALQRHAEVFGASARVHGAAGWQFNAAAARAETALNIQFASDTRGRMPSSRWPTTVRFSGPRNTRPRCRRWTNSSASTASPRTTCTGTCWHARSTPRRTRSIRCMPNSRA